MKKIIYVSLMVLALFSVSHSAFAAWIVNYDAEEQVTYQNTNPDIYLDWYIGDNWYFYNDSIEYSSNGQTAINDAYSFDSSILPVNINASSEGLDWHCGWSQYSEPCPAAPNMYRFNISTQEISLMPQNLAAVAGSTTTSLWVVLVIVCGFPLAFLILDWMLGLFNKKKYGKEYESELDAEIESEKYGYEDDIVLEKTREMNRLSKKKSDI